MTNAPTASKARRTAHGNGKAPFNVVIIYDTRAAAARAMHLFRSLERQFGNELELRCDVWRCDIFGLPEARDLAPAVGATAGLIIIANDADGALSPAAQDWIARCLAAHNDAPKALLQLPRGGDSSVRVERETHRFLERVVQNNGFEFFFAGQADHHRGKSLAEGAVTFNVTGR